MSPQFWQRFLAAEFSAQKSRALLEGLGSFSGDPETYLDRRAAYSDAERRRSDALATRNLDELLATGLSVIEEEQYPETLQEAEGTPPALFYSGDTAALQQPLIAIVGTRSASTYGKACAQKFAEAFARSGATVVSGGALGIDAAAHKGALQAEGRTLAVLAAGVDNVYPAVHGGLFRQIRERGGLVSQFAVGAKPNEYKFLVRNHLIAALSLAVLVIEAPARSGAIRTAEAATDMGRQVFVVPAGIDMLSFQGSFNLIREGATLVDSPDQVLNALGIKPVPHSLPSMPASPAGDSILSVLTTLPLATEFIVEKTGLDTAQVLSELTLLELEGRIIREGGGYAIRP